MASYPQMKKASRVILGITTGYQTLLSMVIHSLAGDPDEKRVENAGDPVKKGQ
jgi:hypothetical protein